MDINLINGSDEQQEAFMGVFSLLMNLPLLTNVDLGVDVEFVANPDPALHNEFAYTESDPPYIRIRDDAPGFAAMDPGGDHWGMPFFNEVVVHELAHALLGNLPDETQEAIAAMFDTTPDDWSPDVPWEQRPLEGICETFKDAFLPRRYRTYGNRTDKKIPNAFYPEFRRHWRDGIANMGGGEIIPDYDFDGMKVTPVGDIGIVLPGDGGVWDTLYTQRPRAVRVADYTDLGTAWSIANVRFEDLIHQATLIAASEWQAYILEGTVLSYGFSVPDPPYPPYTIPNTVDDLPDISQAHSFNSSQFYAPGISFQGPAVAWTALEWFAGLGGGGVEITAAEWLQTDMPDLYNEPGPVNIEGTDTDGPIWATVTGNKAMWEHVAAAQPYWDSVAGSWKVKGDASGTSFSQDIVVDDRYIIEQECQGRTYRLVALRFEVVLELADWTTGDEAEHIAIRESALYPWLPELMIVQSPCSEGGIPIVLPTPELTPGGDTASVHPSKHRIIGTPA